MEIVKKNERKGNDMKRESKEVRKGEGYEEKYKKTSKEMRRIMLKFEIRGN